MILHDPREVSDKLIQLFFFFFLEDDCILFALSRECVSSTLYCFAESSEQICYLGVTQIGFVVKATPRTGRDPM